MQTLRIVHIHVIPYLFLALRNGTVSERFDGAEGDEEAGERRREIWFGEVSACCPRGQQESPHQSHHCRYMYVHFTFTFSVSSQSVYLCGCLSVFVCPAVCLFLLLLIDVDTCIYLCLSFSLFIPVVCVYTCTLYIFLSFWCASRGFSIKLITQWCNKDVELFSGFSIK